jgi:hypothetical protein
MMRKIGLRKLQYLLYALLMLALTGCGASNGNVAGTYDSSPGKVAAKIEFEKSTGKAVASVPAEVLTVRINVTGPYQIAGDTTSASRYTATKATIPAGDAQASVAVAAGKGLIVVVEALGANDVVLYEGVVSSLSGAPIAVVAGSTTDLGTITMKALSVKAAEQPCLSCHESTRDLDGNSLAANYKTSRHYSYKTANSPSLSYNGVTYGNTVGCAGCHGPGHNDVNPAESGRCANCHGLANSPNSHNNFDSVNNDCNLCHNPHTLALRQIPIPTAQAGGCVACHSIPQDAGTKYVQDNKGVRAVKAEFSKWSHHVTGVQLNDAHCAACHLEGQVITVEGKGKVVVNPAKHMADAKTHLRNANDDTDFAWDPATPDFTGMDTYCLSCHDADGAKSTQSKVIQALINKNGYNAPGKTASPTNPFGDTISNQYDKLERPAVVDAAGQFATTNPSHHAVLGKKYSGRTRAGSTRAVAAGFAANSTAALPGARSTIYDAGKFQSDYTTLADAAGETTGLAATLVGRNGGTTLGDDSTLHCGDCHTVGQYRAADAAATNRYNKAVIGAHGSNNEYMLRNNVGTDARHQGAETTGGTSGVATIGYGTKPYLVCFNCHAFATYGSVGGSTGVAGLNHAGEYANSTRCNGPYNTIMGDMTGEARLNSMVTRTDATGATGYGLASGSTFGNVFGIQCNNCHNSGVGGNMFGGIHGSKTATYTDGMGNTTKHIRFMPGLGNTMYVPGTKGGVTGGTLAAYNTYSSNRLTGAALSYTLLPYRTIVPGVSPAASTLIDGKTVASQVMPYNNALPAAGAKTIRTGSYQYTTGGVSNDLNWEQKSAQPVAGEFDFQSKSMGCYTLTPTASVKVAAVKNGDGTILDPAKLGVADAQKGPDGKELFDVWGGCDDHNGAQGAGTAPFRKVLRKTTY